MGGEEERMVGLITVHIEMKILFCTYEDVEENMKV